MVSLAQAPTEKSRYSEMIGLLSRKSACIALIIVFISIPLYANPYTLYVANLAFIYILLATGLNVLVGYTGQLAFSNAALFGIGAYIAGLLEVDMSVPYYLAAPCGVIGATIVGVVIAFPALRLSGLYLALATIGFAYTALWVFMNWEEVTYGAGGFPVPVIDFSPFPISQTIGVYYMSLVVTSILCWLLWNLLRSRIGRAFVAIRESETAAATLGVSLTKYKTIAFGISAFFAGAAGVLFVPLIGVVTPESYDLLNIVMQFCMVMIGGMGTVAGAVIGGTAITIFDEIIREFRGFEEAAFGGLILVSILMMRFGFVGLLKKWLPGWEEPLRRPDRT